MKRFLASLLIISLLAGCAQSSQDLVDADARVQSFRQLFSEAAYAETRFSAQDAASIADVVRQDCGTSFPDGFVRASYVSRAATLAAYVVNGSVACVATKLNQDAFRIERGDPATVENGTLLSVNGEPITLQRLQAAAAQLSPEVRNETSLVSLVNTLVDQTLLRQAAQGIEVPADEVARVADESWRAAGYESKDAFVAALEAQGSSWDAFEGLVRQQLQVERLLVEEGVTAVNVSADAAREFYLQNPNAFLVSEQVRFRQLFVSGERDDAQERLTEALERLKGGLDFCNAVRRYSDDTASAERCGEYLVPRGVVIPALESSLFALPVNGSTVVQSQNGYHVVVVLEHTPSSVVPFAQAEAQVVGLLRDAAVQQRLSIFLLKLRADAEIVDYTQG